jgi:putative hydrolase of the HAD superfamily
MKNITTYYIDLDGTVYDKNNGMLEEMTTRIDRYIHEVLGMPEDQAAALSEKYYRQYGSSLRGLQLHHKIDGEDFLAYIHDIDLDKYLSPDPELRQMLENIPQPKWILTNSDRNHSRRVLNALGLDDIFEGILDVWAMGYIPKPDVRVYQRALAPTGNPHPSGTIFIDDTLKNLKPARQMGIKTVWIDSFNPHPYANLSIPQLHTLPKVLHTTPTFTYNLPGNYTTIHSQSAGLPIVSP